MPHRAHPLSLPVLLVWVMVILQGWMILVDAYPPYPDYPHHHHHHHHHHSTPSCRPSVVTRTKSITVHKTITTTHRTKATLTTDPPTTSNCTALTYSAITMIESFSDTVTSVISVSEFSQVVVSDFTTWVSVSITSPITTTNTYVSVPCCKSCPPII